MPQVGLSLGTAPRPVQPKTHRERAPGDTFRFTADWPTLTFPGTRINSVIAQCPEPAWPGAAVGWEAEFSGSTWIQLAWFSREGHRKPWANRSTINTSLLEIKAEFSFETQLLWVKTLPSAAPHCITPEQDKSRCHCDNYFRGLKTSSFPSQAGEINVRAPHKSPLWKAGQPRCAPREERGYCSGQVNHGERLCRDPRVCAAGRAAATAGSDKGLQLSSPPASREWCFRALHHLRTTGHIVMREMETPRSSSPPPLPS